MWTKTLNTEKQEASNLIETQYSENGNTTRLSITAETLTQEERINVESNQKILTKKRIT